MDPGEIVLLLPQPRSPVPWQSDLSLWQLLMLPVLPPPVILPKELRNGGDSLLVAFAFYFEHATLLLSCHNLWVALLWEQFGGGVLWGPCSGGCVKWSRLFSTSNPPSAACNNLWKSCITASQVSLACS